MSPAPISPVNLSRYVASLARRLAYSSIPGYLNVVRLLHLEFENSNPLVNNWPLTSLLRGIKRSKGNASNKKLPITPQVLLDIHKFLDFQSPTHVVFWAACLVAFFCLLRKASLLPPSIQGFSAVKHLSRGSFQVQPWGLSVSLGFSKTNQFQERSVTWPLPAIPNNCLCPVTAVLMARDLVPSAVPGMPAFLVPSVAGPSTLTAAQFIDTLGAVLQQAGYPAGKYSGHSFRRGGASYAFACGVPSEVIKMLGDWKSDAYLGYVDIPLELRATHVFNLASQLPTD